MRRRSASLRAIGRDRSEVMTCQLSWSVLMRGSRMTFDRSCDLTCDQHRFSWIRIRWEVSVGQLIVVSGNLGAGKTTLSSALAMRFNGIAFSEQPAEYPYLEDMYADLRRWSFNNQLSFMTKKAEEHLRIVESSRLGIQDRGVFETHEVFSRTFQMRGILDARDFGTLERVLSLLRPRLTKPDALIFLYAPTDFLVSRIEQRHRSSEHQVWPSLLDHLGRYYEAWFSCIKREMTGRVLSVDMSKVDFVSNPLQLDDICNEVRAIVQTVSESKL